MKRSEDAVNAWGLGTGDWGARLMVGILLPLLMAFDVMLKVPVLDSFHEGEYLGNIETMRQFFSGGGAFPVLIHGAMDYLPALWAAHWGGDDNVIVLTRFFNVAAVAVCWIAWVDLARLALRRHPQALVWSALFIVVFLLMAGSAGEDPVRKQQAFLGTRDVFLVLSLWTGVHACQGKGPLAVVAALACGLFASASLYWSYDRGFISAVWLAVLAAGLALRGARRVALALPVSYAAGLWLVSSVGIAASLHDNLRNVLYWLANTGDIWNMPGHEKMPALPGALAMVAFSACVCVNAWRVAVRDWHATVLPMVAALIAVQALFFMKLFSLPIFPTSYYYIWPSVLILVLVPPSWPPLATLDAEWRRQASALWDARGFGGRRWGRYGAVALVGIFLSNPIVLSARAARHALRPVPDRELLSAARYGLDGLDRVKAPCVFQWSNEGVFAFAEKLAYCLPYTYPVYISRSQEAAALQELRAKPPRLIVYDSPNWSMNIYGRNMRERLPLIDNFINEHYALSHTASGYVFATLKPTEPPSSQP